MRYGDDFVSYVVIPELDWRVVSVSPADEALQPLARTQAELEGLFSRLLGAVRLNSLAIVLAFLLLSVAVAHLVAREITTPIHEVVDGIGHLAHGNLQARVPVHGRDELAFLAEAFNRMTEELNRSRDELLHSRARTENIMQSLPDVLLMVDAEFHITACNPVALESLGYAREELIGTELDQLFAPDSLPADARQRFRGEDQVEGLEARLRTSYGEDVPVVVATNLLRDRDQRVLGFALTARDVTEQLQVEEDRRRLAAIVQSSTDFIATMSLDGHVLFLNPAGRRMNGIESASQLLGRDFVDFCSEEERTEIEEEILPTVRDEGHWEGLLTLAPDNRPLIPALFNLTAIRDPRLGRPVLLAGIGRDITERQRALDQLKLYAADLERSNRELEQFAFVASHDLREPLRKLHNLSQLLERRYDEQLDEKGRQILDYISESAVRMLSLIKDLLEYSRVGSRTKTLLETSADDALSTAIANLGMAIEETGGEITRDPLPTVVADPEQLVLLFQNLLANALKFHGDRPPRIHVGATHQDNEHVFSVRDHGIGIDPVHQERIFIIFQRLQHTSDDSGTGIGLAICKKIVDRHRGRIWVDSREGEGATFYFTIPDRPVTPQGSAHGPRTASHSAG